MKLFTLLLINALVSLVTPVSGQSDPDALPIIYQKDKSIVFRIGDPVLYENKGVKTVFTIANIDYNGTYKGIKCYGYVEPDDINLNNIDLVNGYNYIHYPAGVVNGTGDKFKEGDKVEVLCLFDQFSKYKWEKGIVVSVDGDNYYIYRPGTSRRPEEEYFWNYISDIRAIGSAKTTKMPPEYGSDNTNPNVDTYLKMINSAQCSEGESNWEFLWFYRHEFNPVNGYDAIIAYNGENFKTMLDAYNCMYEVRKNYPDIGVSGADLNRRYDVQWEFLQKRKEYIATGLQRMSQSGFYNFTLKVKTGYYAKEMSKFKGLDDLKQKIKEENKAYEENAAKLGISLAYPWEQLEKAYQEGLQKFMKDGTVAYQGLRYDNDAFPSKDAKAEAVAIKYVLANFPGSKVLDSGTSGDFIITKNDIGIPTNRVKGVIVIHQNPDYRTCIITYCYYQEEYAGGGTYATGHINSQLTGNNFLKSCK